MGNEPRPLQRCLRLDLEYDGTEYLGWQRQAEGRTVQEAVEAALERILGTAHPVVGAGRTDTGVHAAHMVASLRTASPMPAAELERALDAVLPPDVTVTRAADADPSFNARRDARWKWYRYSLLTGSRRRPLLRRTTWHVRGGLDRRVLVAGAAALVGRKDFKAFASEGSPRRSTVRTLHVVRWRREGDLLHLDLVGDGFLYRMVRSVVGTLVAWGLGRGAASARPPGDPGPWARGQVAALLAARDRSAAGPVAPARALCLRAVGVDHDDAARRLPHFLRPDVESGASSSIGGPH